MGSKKILVVGWYDKGNLGDEAFKHSFQLLWQNALFTFTDQIPPSEVNAYDCLWIGGGSFLDLPMPFLDLVTIPIGYIGVGLGDNVHPDHLAAFKRARILVARDNELAVQYASKTLDVEIAPDLVFAQPCLYPNKGLKKKIVVIGNDFLSPKYQSQEWQLVGFHWFCQEFAKIADWFIDRGMEVSFIPMCVNQEIDDRRFNSQIITRMKNRSKANWALDLNTEYLVRNEIAEAELVVSLRLHGAIYSLIAGTPFVLVGSHEKMNHFMWNLNTGVYLDYYGFTSKQFDAAIQKPIVKAQSQYPDKARESWKCIADTVARIFCL